MKMLFSRDRFETFYKMNILFLAQQYSLKIFTVPLLALFQIGSNQTDFKRPIQPKVNLMKSLGFHSH